MDHTFGIFFRLCNSLPPYEVLNTMDLILLPKKVFIQFAGPGPLLTLNLCGGHANENLQKGHVEPYSCVIHDKRKSLIFFFKKVSRTIMSPLQYAPPYDLELVIYSVRLIPPEWSCLGCIFYIFLNDDNYA